MRRPKKGSANDNNTNNTIENTTTTSTASLESSGADERTTSQPSSHWAIANRVTTKSTKARNFAVKIGTQRTVSQGLVLEVHSYVDNRNYVRAAAREIIPWDEILFGQKFFAYEHLATCPEVGKVWKPFFAMKPQQTPAPQQDRPTDLHDAGDLYDTAVVLSGDNVPLNVLGSQNRFPRSASELTGATAKELLKLEKRDAAQLPVLMKNALVEGTRKEHERMLEHIKAMPDHLAQLPLAAGIATHLHQLSRGKWLPTTLFKYMCSAQGAVRLLPIYRKGAASILLSDDPTWKLAMKGARHAAVEHIPNQPKAASVNDIAKALSAAKGAMKASIRAVIMFAWLTAARLGCIRQLKAEDLKFNEADKTLNITFRRGKGVRCRQQAYTVTTLILSEGWWRELRGYVNERPGFLFPKALTDNNITTPLKVAGIEQRSIRRGALQTMAAEKVPPEILMNFSGHASVKTLNRYLDFGLKRADLAASSVKAAKALWKDQLLTDEWWNYEEGHQGTSSSLE